MQVQAGSFEARREAHRRYLLRRARVIALFAVIDVISMFLGFWAINLVLTLIVGRMAWVTCANHFNEHETRFILCYNCYCLGAFKQVKLEDGRYVLLCRCGHTWRVLNHDFMEKLVGKYIQDEDSG